MTPQYNRLAQGLQIYRQSMRKVIGTGLRRDQGGKGNWFDIRVLGRMEGGYRANLETEYARAKAEGRVRANGEDAEALLDLQHFRQVLSRNSGAFPKLAGKRTLKQITEIGNWRNSVAHPPLEDFDADEVERVLGLAIEVLGPVDQVAQEQVRQVLIGMVLEASPPHAEPEPEPEPVMALQQQTMGELTPWRRVIDPHRDVRDGNYDQAEFAADLMDAQRPDAAPEYSDPAEFFSRTFLTEHMESLLRNVLQRLKGAGGEPVIDLRTAFGGGKTHTLLAAMHMVRSPEAASTNREVGALFDDVGTSPQGAKVAVLVGTYLDAKSLKRTADETGGFDVHSLWGELAWQLAGEDGFNLVRQHDQGTTAPGAQVLGQLFAMAGPSVILIDELVAYIRNAGGTSSPLYNAHMTFCQALTEAASASPHTALLVSIPESTIEFGDEAGERIANQISNVFQRKGAPWQPVSAQEGFEVVRRRLFEPMRRGRERIRNETCEAYFSYYQDHPLQFPSECREPTYLQRMKDCYPIHPEVFDRLYEDWAANIDRFQKTRGVLKLMADVIHRLYRDGRQDPLITPGSLPMYYHGVRQQLVGYLPDQWNPPLDADIDGEDSESWRADREQTRFGGVQACAAIARTVFLGSVPGKTQLGLERPRIMLGAAHPAASPATWSDALDHLDGRLSYLHGSGNRYWFAVTPNLNRMAADRIDRITRDQALAELRKRMNSREFRAREPFAGVHPSPQSNADVPDQTRVRLVIFGPAWAHTKDDNDSEAQRWAEEVLRRRGELTRDYKNMLAFLAPDSEQIERAVAAARQYLGWNSIVEEGQRGYIPLDQGQNKQAHDRREQADDDLAKGLADAWKWIFAPEHSDKPGEVNWFVQAVGAGDTAAERAGTVLEEAGMLNTQWAPIHLHMQLQNWIWTDDVQHVSAKTMWENLAKYLYFPRVLDERLFVNAVEQGIRSREYFGYADGWDGKRYLGLKFGEGGHVVLDGTSVIVHADAASAQQAAETPTPDPTPVSNGFPPTPSDEESITRVAEPAASRRITRSFYGRMELDPERMGTQAGQIGEEIVRHLHALADAEVEVTLDIRATTQDGISESMERTLKENAKTLGFEETEFEPE